MNETAVAIAGILVPLFAGLITWIVNGFHVRIKSLEDVGEELGKTKLDKEDYYRDQGAMRETLRVMSNDIKEVSNAIREWPKELMNILSQAGKI